MNKSFYNSAIHGQHLKIRMWIIGITLTLKHYSGRQGYVWMVSTDAITADGTAFGRAAGGAAHHPAGRAANDAGDTGCKNL
jgi:hypothetical protein